MYELWRDIVTFRKQFTELKGSTERDMMRERNDLAQTGRSLTSACFGFLTANKNVESQGQVIRRATIGRLEHVCRLGGHRTRTSRSEPLGESDARENPRNSRSSAKVCLVQCRAARDRLSRSHDLTQQNEKLRLQLSEKDGTITTLTNAQQTHHQATVRFLLLFFFFQNALRSAVFHSVPTGTKLTKLSNYSSKP